MRRKQSRLGSVRPSRSVPKRQYCEPQGTKAVTRQWPHSLTVRSNVNLHGSQSNSTTVSPFHEISVDSVKADPSGANGRAGEAPQRRPAPLRESSRRPNPDRAAARPCKNLSFFTFLAGHRSSLRACVPGFRGISSLRWRYSTTRHFGTLGRYRFLSPEGKKNCWWRGTEHHERTRNGLRRC